MKFRGWTSFDKRRYARQLRAEVKRTLALGLVPPNRVEWNVRSTTGHIIDGHPGRLSKWKTVFDVVNVADCEATSVLE